VRRTARFDGTRAQIRHKCRDPKERSARVPSPKTSEGNVESTANPEENQQAESTGTLSRTRRDPVGRPSRCDTRLHPLATPAREAEPDRDPKIGTTTRNRRPECGKLTRRRVKTSNAAVERGEEQKKETSKPPISFHQFRSFSFSLFSSPLSNPVYPTIGGCPAQNLWKNGQFGRKTGSWCPGQGPRPGSGPAEPKEAGAPEMPNCPLGSGR